MPRAERRQTSIELEIQERLMSIQHELLRRQQEGHDSIFFIPVTGGEGCGKTTLLENLGKRLQEAGIDVATIKMMGGNPVGDLLRQVILSIAAGEADVGVMTALLQASMETAAAKAQQQTRHTGLTPHVILCDRSPYDTGVYQYIAETPDSDDLDESYVGYQYEQARIVTEQNKYIFTNRGIAPTITILIDLDPGIGLARKAAQKQENRFEKKGLRYHQKVRKGFAYFKKHSDYTNSIVTLDGTRTAEQLVSDSLSAIYETLLEHKDRVIVGEPSGIDAARYWFENERDIERTLRILDTRIIRTTDDAIEYAQLLTDLFYWLRDTKPMFVETIRERLLASPMVGYLDRYAYGSGMNGFRQELRELSNQEVIAKGYVIAYDLRRSVIHATSHAYPNTRYDMFPYIEEKK